MPMYGGGSEAKSFFRANGAGQCSAVLEIDLQPGHMQG